MTTDRPVGYWLKHLDRAGLHEALAPFWTAGNGPGPDEVLAVPAARGLTGRGADLGLTEEGRAIHTRALERVERTRGTVLTGLTPEEYARTVRVLSVMAADVEADLAAR